MIRSLLTLILFFVTTSVLAVAAPSLHSAAVSSGTDLSISYLGMAFGHVGNVISGTSGVMFGNLMREFNKGVMVIAAFILGYNTIFIVLRLTTEGTLMSPNKNTHLILFRIAVGFSLLIPMSDGYNLLQTTMMSIVKASVSFADTIWGGMLDKVKDGQVIWHVPSDQGSSYVGGDISKGAKDGDPLSLGLLTPTYLKGNLASGSGKLDPNPTTVPATESALNKYAEDVRSSTGQKPDAFLEVLFENMVCLSLRTVSNVGYSPYYSTSEKKLYFTTKPIEVGTTPSAECGTVDIGQMTDELYTKEKDGKYQSIADQVIAMADKFKEPAKLYVCSKVTDATSRKIYRCGDSPSNSGDDIPKWQSDAKDVMLINYSALGQLTSNAKSRQQQSKGGPDRTGFVKQAKEEGWVMAGSFYWALANLQGAIHEVGYDTAFGETITQGKPTSFVDVDTANHLEDLQKDTVTTSALAYAQEIQGSKTASKGKTGGTETMQGAHGLFGGLGLFLSILFGPFGSVVLSFFRILAMFSTDGGVLGMGSDPILWLHRLGMSCMDLSADLWFTGMLANSIVLLPFIVCRPLVDMMKPTEQAFAWFKIIIVSSAAMFLTVGVLCGFMVPLYPFMVFVFAVIGWLVAVVESLVAMPLVALGITHPEGHDLLGKAEQALMLILSVFLRPALMVIGLISGMILSYVALRFLIWTYSSFLLDLFSPVPGSTGELTGSVWAAVLRSNVNVSSTANSPWALLLKFFITTPLMLFIFAALVYQAVIACYSMIFALPDFILRWIGGPQQQSAINPASMAQEVVGKAQGFAGQIGKMAGDYGVNKIKKKDPAEGEIGGGSK
jgi:defect in organelle trafficking protein DotA